MSIEIVSFFAVAMTLVLVGFVSGPAVAKKFGHIHPA
jgi:multisubunit Na+/H+ antiporter MnhF subunit